MALESAAEQLVIPPGFDAVFDNWHAPVAFYKSAMERSDAMLENVAAQMQRRRIDRAIFVSGGFHTRYITDNLSRRFNIATVTVTPRVNALDDRAYRARLKEDLDRKDEKPTAPADPEPLWIRAWLSIERLRQSVISPLASAARMAAERRIAELVRLRGGELILFSGCRDSDLYIPLARRLQDGLILAIDRFDFYIGGNLVEWGSASPVLNKVSGSGTGPNVIVANMVLHYLNCRNNSFDIVISSTFDSIVRGYDVRRALAEIQRALKPNGTAILYAGLRSRRRMSYFEETANWDLRWVPVSSIYRSLGIIVARRRG